MYQIIKEEFYKEKPVLDVNRLVLWKKEHKQYNFKALPSIAILTINRGVVSKKIKLRSKKLKGINGKNYVLNNALVICFDFGNGAPAVINLMEELRALGVKTFIYLGFAGILTTNLKAGDLFVVNKSFSMTGCSKFYNGQDCLELQNNKFVNEFLSKLNFKEVAGVSTDAPFRETASFLEEFVNKGAKVIDMECAAIYAFSSFYNLNAICLTVGADRLLNAQWTPPNNLKLINKTFKSNFKLLLKLLS
ncbi:phosphorylase family protein [Winogradskyella endarachnes]|uniref:Uridine phosphorylase n=1 Tax=Winogradskyella endarachnes TaxID=2681965 RepID=A0A6L6UAC6_9FLAO|nr:hypothetical protein [Winogradskyella endarachnes]MUU79285.1 hypothetical protein [Winogradskyella endarachnes]